MLCVLPIILLWTVWTVESYSHGAPCVTQYSMRPDPYYHSPDGQSLVKHPPPFQFKVLDPRGFPVTKYHAGITYTARLTGNMHFRGFLLQPRQVDHKRTAQGVQKVGHFVEDGSWSRIGIRPQDCTGTSSNSITHMNLRKKYYFNIKWKAPIATGPVQFTITLVINQTYFWVKWQPNNGFLVPYTDIPNGGHGLNAAMPHVRQLPIGMKRSKPYRRNNTISVVPTHETTRHFLSKVTMNPATSRPVNLLINHWTPTAVTPKYPHSIRTTPLQARASLPHKAISVANNAITSPDKQKRTGESISKPAENSIGTDPMSKAHTAPRGKTRHPSNKIRFPAIRLSRPVIIRESWNNLSVIPSTARPGLALLPSNRDANSQMVQNVRVDFRSTTTYPAPPYTRKRVSSIKNAPGHPHVVQLGHSRPRTTPAVTRLISPIRTPSESPSTFLSSTSRSSDSLTSTWSWTTRQQPTAVSPLSGPLEAPQQPQLQPANNARKRQTISVVPCPTDLCMNGGKCYHDGSTVPLCDCEPGWTGADCTVEINECERNPCENGAVCTDNFNGYRCACPDGFSGRNCQRPCIDIYQSCGQWKEEDRCEFMRAFTSFFDENCALTCESCSQNNNTVIIGLPLPPVLEPLAFMVGRWVTNGTTYHYPSNFAPEEGYTEMLEISITKVPMFGVPSLNFSAVARSLVNSSNVYESNGFLTLEDRRLPKRASLLTVHNSGMAMIEEGIVGTMSLELKITSVIAHPTAFKKPLRGKLKRSFSRWGDYLQIDFDTVTEHNNIERQTIYYWRTIDYSKYYIINN